MPKPPNKPLNGSDSPLHETYVSRTGRSGASEQKELRHSVTEFAAEIRDRHGLLDRKVARKVSRRLEYLITPRPRIGRPPEERITRATKMYERQRLACNGRRVNWKEIGRECIPGYDEFRSDYRRRVELMKLRNAVYSRLKRRQAVKHEPRS